MLESRRGQTIHESRPDGAPTPTLPADPGPAITRLTGDSCFHLERVILRGKRLDNRLNSTDLAMLMKLPRREQSSSTAGRPFETHELALGGHGGACATEDARRLNCGCPPTPQFRAAAMNPWLIPHRDWQLRPPAILRNLLYILFPQGDKF